MNRVFPQAAPATALPPARRAQAETDQHALWYVRMLGGLSLSDGTQHITRLPSRAVTALLARLALAPERAHAREELIELLWPGVALGVGRNRLRQALSTLKSMLEPAGRLPAQPVLQADRISVRVLPGSLDCDALRFERSVQAGQIDAARALYRGELLPGFYDDWIDEERLRLAALHERLARYPQTAQTAQTPQTALAMPPASAPWRQAAQSAARVNLPTYLTRMFGADAQGARLRGMVLAHRLVTLIGPGGAGKTRLAIEMAHSLRPDSAGSLATTEPFEPFDLIAFVPLAACTTRAQACDALTGVLQIAPAAAEPVRALVDALAGRRALLLLDNFEQLVGVAQDLVEQLVGQLPALHLVVTSRRALGVDGEHELALAVLELPAVDADVASAAGNAAVALFVDRARAVRTDFHFGARNGATLVELVRALQGMPLAIELAASRVRSIAPADLLARLRGSGTPQLDLLSRTGPRGTLDARHTSMQRVIAWSWQQLAAGPARLLSALTVFPGGFTAAAAAALVAEEPLDAQLLLDDLVANSLVQVQVQVQAGDVDALRFALYQPIREFAAAQLDDATARHWRQRLRGWALDWARTLPRTPPLTHLRLEMPNLVAALASAVDDAAPHDAIQLLIELRRCLEDVELPAEGLAHAQAAVEQCADLGVKASGHAVLGPLLFTAGQPDAALRHAELGLHCAPLVAAQRARALHSLARVRWRSRRRADEVEPLLAEAQALALPSGDLELRASVLALRAFVANAQPQGRVDGEQLHAQALALWEQLGNQHAIDSGRYNLAVCAQNTGRNQQALQRLAPVIASARELHDWRRLNQSLNVRGNAFSGLRDWPSAMADYQECIRTAWRGMASFDLAFGLWNLPRTLAHLRQPEAAVRLAAYAAAFWCGRFGDLSASDQRDLQRVRRLAARQIDAAQIATLWREGEHLSLAQAVALALTAQSPD